MYNLTIVAAFSGILFCAMIINLAAKPKFATKLMGISILCATIGGLLLYSYGFSSNTQGYLAIVRTTLAVCGMFVGKNDFSAIKETALLQNPAIEFLFWILHLMALYATASAAITTIGAGLLKKMKLLLIRRGDLVIVYGVNDDSVSFVQQLQAEEDGAVIFVDENPTSESEKTVSSMGCIMYCDSKALNPNARFLKSIGVKKGKRQIKVYALDKNTIYNVEYAKKLLSALEQIKVMPTQTSLVLVEEDEEIGIMFQVSEKQYGYGSVAVVSRAGLVARLLMQKYPPYRMIDFDDKARAMTDFDALIVGFGKIGQAVLRQLVMNAQFEGSHFSAAVFASNCEQVKGYFAHECKTMLEEYRICFYAEDARSDAMYEYLKEHRNTLKYVVLATGNEKMNEEIEFGVRKYLEKLGNGAAVYRCSYEGIYSCNGRGLPIHNRIYSPEVLSFGRIDQKAIALNNHYCKGEETDALANWAKCDYFSRMSSRASADFTPALLWALGQKNVQKLREGVLPEQEILENLGRTEHLRWCAFHYSMGFEKMDESTYEERARLYRKEKELTGTSAIRIGKDVVAKKHACLIPWEGLKALSAKENAITGGNVNYETLEVENVIGLILQEE